MKPIKFKEANKELQRPAGMTDSQCSSLFVVQTGDVCISCWKMSPRDRWLSLLFGKVWLTIRSGQTQPPVKLTIDKPFW